MPLKSQRLLELLLRLQARSPRPARELARALEVTERTIYRDVETLSAAGVPIYTIRGSQGGIALMEGYRQAISALVDEEIRALFAGGPDPLADLGFGDRLASAREKLFGALSAAQRQHAIKVRERVRIERQPWGRHGQPLQTLSLLRSGLWEDRVIAVTYRNQSGAISTRSLEPLGIVFKAGTWYCVARHAGKTATFRVERMLSVEVLPTSFHRPNDFDLDAYWQESEARYMSRATGCVVRVLGARRDLEQLAVFWPTRIDAGRADDTAAAEVEFQLHEQAVHELVPWSHRLTIASPATVRAEVVARLRSGLANHARGARQA